MHTDKAIKELRARLDQAERERDEANERHAALAEHVVACLPYEAETDGEALDAWECVDAASREIARLQREREAVARERARWMRHARHPMGCARDGGHPCDCGLDEARATSPAPVASAERAVVDAYAFGATWYAYDPETGYDTFSTAEEAERAAEESLDHHRDGSTEGWHENVGDVEWGLLVPHGETRQCDVVDAEDDPSVAANGWDYRCDYRLHSVRSAAVDALAAARKGGERG